MLQIQFYNILIINNIKIENMKTHLLILLAIFCTIGNLQAQDIRIRNKYRNLSFSQVEMKDDYSSLKSNYGGAFTVGKTFFVHKKPIAGMIRFGIDATWFDINYANYTIESAWEDEEEGGSLDAHQLEIAMQVGPSVTVNPVGKLCIHGYFRYAPSFSALYMDESFMGNYASFFVGGGSVSYGVIGLGIEARYGNCKYKGLFGSDGDEETDGAPIAKTKFSGMRAYLTFRF